MKLIFAGTPQFAAEALAALLTEHQIVAVLTQPDRPSGRGMHLAASPVKHLALQHGLPVLQPATLKNAEIQQQLAACEADVMVVAAYGLILPSAVLQLPCHGCLNVHASLLPRWRGAAPIQRAILAGDSETGITIMQMDEGLDTGAMLLKKVCKIDPADTAQTLHDKLAVLGGAAILEALNSLQAGSLHAVCQDENLATYAAKLSKSEAQLNWTQTALELERAVRAYYPFPTASTVFDGIVIRLIRAHAATGHPAPPGTVLETGKNHILVACGTGALALEILQRPGGKPLPAPQFLSGFPIKAGDRFQTA